MVRQLLHQKKVFIPNENKNRTEHWLGPIFGLLGSAHHHWAAGNAEGF